MIKALTRAGKNRSLLGLGAAVIIAAGTYFGTKAIKSENPFLNFAVVKPEVLLRSGQPYPGDIENLYSEYGFRTILCLNESERPELYEFAAARGIRVICMKMRASDPPTREQVRLFFEMVQGKEMELARYSRIITACPGCEGKRIRFEKPVLVHCIGGSDRTGIMIALYRVQFEGWSKAAAKREMIRHFHNPLRYPALLDFLEAYEPEPENSARALRFPLTSQGIPNRILNSPSPG
jgi:protein tyrosine/serine phosphatase